MMKFIVTSALAGILVFLLAAHPAALKAQAQQGSPLPEQIEQIIQRPVFRHASFGIEFYSLDSDKPLYEMNPQKLFTPASTTKLLTEGTAMDLLGPGYRFHTRVYRTGPVTAGGTLEGDLVMVGSGDPNLSQRIQPNGTLAFENDDHCYGGPAVPGNPLVVIEQLAAQVAARGIRRVDGRVLADASLFPEGQPELGTGTIISPFVINDNIVDVTASPGQTLGSPVTLTISPATSYVRFIDLAVTGPADIEPDIEWTKDVQVPGGTHTVTVTGRMPIGKPSQLFPYAIPQPRRFAEIALASALRDAGVTVAGAGTGSKPDFQQLAADYTAANLVAEHISPPLSEDVKITLKVSQNLHASLMPYILGAVVGHAADNIEQEGFILEHNFLEKAGLDLSGASQSDGAGGSPAAFFTPDFMVHYLAFMYHHKVFPQLFAGLPVMGRDGTLTDIQTHSPAAGHIFAKTGTFDDYDMLNQNDMVTGKGLAGYFTTPGGDHVAFAIYANEVAVPGHGEQIEHIVGQALGEIAVAAYFGLGK
ncbi:MAG: D-alanyl-D-alanine carboxypeptidase/D-alanyl-D-alanine-endopeptidase [Acidobacteriota bacterium]|nr:D-alanyl-D-alanine carboxypeptidase/D-alanyl-D-alanine-endopeptidase [Acidobacteriota bacterium]